MISQKAFVMMVHDRYCFQVDEGILLNVFPAENFRELYYGNKNMDN